MTVLELSMVMPSSSGQTCVCDHRICPCNAHVRRVMMLMPCIAIFRCSSGPCELVGGAAGEVDAPRPLLCCSVQSGTCSGAGAPSFFISCMPKRWAICMSRSSRMSSTASSFVAGMSVTPRFKSACTCSRLGPPGTRSNLPEALRTLPIFAGPPAGATAGAETRLFREISRTSS